MSIIKSNFSPSPFFDDFFTRDFLNWGMRNRTNNSATLPAVNIMETNDGFTVEMAAPGMHKNDFRIQLDNELLTITSEKQHENEETDHQYTRREFSYQSFQRSFHLPRTVVDESKIKAKYENGILSILIPKREEAKALPPRRIKIG